MVGGYPGSVTTRSPGAPLAAPLPDSIATLPDIWHGVRLGVAPESSPPFAIDALVVEDDTWQVLGADPEFRPTAEHPLRLMQALRQAEPVAPGSVFVVPGRPTRLHAVVHDLDRDPSWREEWIAAALEGCLGIASERGFRSLAIPLLGTRHGGLAPDRAVGLLEDSLAAPSAPLPRKLWLISP